MILVTGASGTVGGQVLTEVVKSGKPVKALFRSEKDSKNLPPGAQPVIADFSDRAAMDRALGGVDEVFLVCGPVPELVELESRAIEACKAAGVKHLILNSALGAGIFDASFPRWHTEVEKALAASGLRHSIIRPNSFMQNILNYFAPTIQTQGAFYSSMGNARVSFTYTQVAELVSQVTGKATRYVDIPVAQQRHAMLDQHMPVWQVDALLDLQRYYTEGRGGEVDTVFADVVGRQPVKLAEFLKEFASAFMPPLAHPA